MEYSKGAITNSVLTSSVTIYPDPEQSYTCYLTPTQIVLVPEDVKGKTIILDSKDIIGCDRMRGENKNDVNGYLQIYYYEKKKRLLYRHFLRHSRPVFLTFYESRNFSKNQRKSEQWRISLLRMLRGLPICDNEGILLKEVPLQRRMLVFINPFSGPGKASQMYEEKISPVLKEAGFHCVPFITEYPGHAKKEIQSLNLKEWYGIAIVSGDGLVHEVINGLMSREDCLIAMKIPLAVFPGGSGNALCCSVNYASSECFLEEFALHSSFVVAKHDIRPLDVIAIDIGPERYYSFLTLTWGIIAEIDIESEKLRALGNARFTVGALYKLIGLRTYRAKISYLPIKDFEKPKKRIYTRSLTESDDCEEKKFAKQHRRSKSQNPPPTEYGDNDEDFENVSELPQCQIDKKLIINSNDGDCNNPSEFETGQDYISHDEGYETFDKNSEANSQKAIINPFNLSLSDPIPDDWITMDDEFVGIAASNVTHISPGTCLSPGSEFDDGVIYLTYYTKEVTRNEVFNSFQSGDDGKHLTGGVKQVKCYAFRIDPYGESNMAIDGESIPCQPVQGQIVKGIGRLMTI